MTIKQTLPPIRLRSIVIPKVNAHTDSVHQTQNRRSSLQSHIPQSYNPTTERKEVKSGAGMEDPEENHRRLAALIPCARSAFDIQKHKNICFSYAKRPNKYGATHALTFSSYGGQHALADVEAPQRLHL